MKKSDKFNYKKEKCEFENQSWCELPKYKRCKYCIRLKDGSKACELEL